MPYDSTQKTQGSKTTAHPSATTRSRQGPYVTPRLAKIATSPSTPPTREFDQSPSHATPKQANRKSLAEADVTPVRAALSANVTPRSSSRRSRVRSLSSTPNGSPTEAGPSPRPKSMVMSGNRAPPSATTAGPTRKALRTTTHTRSGSINSTLSSSSTPASRASPRQHRPSSSQDSSPTFFRASDTRAFPLSKSTSQLPRQKPSKGSGFVYANGKPEGPRAKQLDKPLRPRLAQSQSTTVDETLPSVPKSPPPKLSRSSPASIVPLTGLAGRSRPTSPLKESVVPRADVVPAPEAKFQESKSSDPWLIASPVQESRRATKPTLDAFFASPTGDPDQPSQPKGGLALTTVPEAALSGRSISSTSASSVLGPEGASTVATDRVSVASPAASKSPESPFTSPLRLASADATANNRIERQKALAADARRERKVLDLEISNSSLLTINRTLEREMRKQTAELRRYRRLTSAGRLSLTTTSKRSLSSNFSTDTSLDDMSGVEEEADADLSDLSDLDDDANEGTETGDAVNPDRGRSSSALAARRAQQRANDEARLQLDLAKHRELLVDSQRMTQCIKRCLERTEDLIGEGRKALEHRVRVSDANFGGRVLADDEAGIDLTQRHGLLSPAIEKPQLDFDTSELTESEAQQVHAMDAIVESLEELQMSPERDCQPQYGLLLDDLRTGLAEPQSLEVSQALD